jgi:hypothetical protein
MAKQKPNWTDREKVVLLEEYEKIVPSVEKIHSLLTLLSHVSFQAILQLG